MAMELYFYNECGFSQSVLNCMTNLHCEDKITKKNIRENPDFETELIVLTGAKTVPVLVIDGKPMNLNPGDASGRSLQPTGFLRISTAPQLTKLVEMIYTTSS